MMMKKLMTMALMAAAATTAFAQDAVVKEAKKLLSSKDFDAAIAKLAPALTSDETLDKEAAWKLQSDINYDKFIAIQTIDAQNQLTKQNTPYDTLGMYKAAVATWEAALKCDEFDQLPDAKGKVKLKYRSASQGRFKNHGIALVQAGQFFYNQKDQDEALKDWELYLNMRNTSIFEGVKDFPQDPFFYDIAYYAAFLSYQNKDYVKAERYARLTAQDPAKADEAKEILLFSQKENCKTAADTLAFINHLKDLHKAEPAEQRYFNLLVEFYAKAGNEEMRAFAEEEIAADANNKTAWFLKGYADMQDEKWDAAIEDYKKTIEIDPAYIEGYFNLGVCYNSKARALQDELADKRTGTITVANFEKVKEVLAVSKVYLEKARELDPLREKCNWAYPLWQVYYALKMDKEAAEMEALNK